MTTKQTELTTLQAILKTLEAQKEAFVENNGGKVANPFKHNGFTIHTHLQDEYDIVRMIVNQKARINIAKGQSKKTTPTLTEKPAITSEVIGFQEKQTKVLDRQLVDDYCEVKRLELKSELKITRKDASLKEVQYYTGVRYGSFRNKTGTLEEHTILGQLSLTNTALYAKRVIVPEPTKPEAKLTPKQDSIERQKQIAQRLRKRNKIVRTAKAKNTPFSAVLAQRLLKRSNIVHPRELG